MPEDLTDADEWTEPLTVPEGGDDRNAASIVPAFQTLANRARWVKERFAAIFSTANTWTADQTFAAEVALDGPATSAGGLNVTSGDVALAGATNELVYTTKRPRTICLPLSSGFPTNGTDDQQELQELFWLSTFNGARSAFPIKLPHGADLGVIKIGLFNNGGGPANITAGCGVRVANKVTPASTITIGSHQIAGGGSAVVAVPAGANYVYQLNPIGTVPVNAATTEFFLSLELDAGLRVYWIEVSFADPGPRNF